MFSRSGRESFRGKWWLYSIVCFLIVLMRLGNNGLCSRPFPPSREYLLMECWFGKKAHVQPTKERPGFQLSAHWVVRQLFWRGNEIVLVTSQGKCIVLRITCGAESLVLHANAFLTQQRLKKNVPDITWLEVSGCFLMPIALLNIESGWTSMRIRWHVHISGRWQDYFKRQVKLSLSKYVLCNRRVAIKMVISNHGQALSASWFKSGHWPYVERRSAKSLNK